MSAQARLPSLRRGGGSYPTAYLRPGEMIRLAGTRFVVKANAWITIQYEGVGRQPEPAASTDVAAAHTDQGRRELNGGPCRRGTRHRRWPVLARRLSAAAPTATAGMVLLVGLGLAGRAVFAFA